MGACRAADTTVTAVTTGLPQARVSGVGRHPDRPSWAILGLPIWQTRPPPPGSS